jgi:hypothetical protein
MHFKRVFARRVKLGARGQEVNRNLRKEIMSWVLVGLSTNAVADAMCGRMLYVCRNCGSSTIELGKQLVELGPVLSSGRELAVLARDNVLDNVSVLQ